MTDQTTTISTDAKALADKPKGSDFAKDTPDKWKMTILEEVADDNNSGV